MRRNRIPIIDEALESCRLMPSWIQFIFVIIVYGVLVLFIPLIPTFFWGTIIVLQLMFILLLVNKNIVYKSISKPEVAVDKMIIWVHSKRDDKEKKEKTVFYLVLIAVTILLFYKIRNLDLLIINSLFCLLFFLKFLFYVPLVSVRMIDENKDVFMVIDKGTKVITELSLHLIKMVGIKSDKIEIETIEGEVVIPIDFSSGSEIEKLEMFLKKIDRFEIR